MKRIPVIPVVLALIGSGFIVSTLSGFSGSSQHAILEAPSQVITDTAAAFYPSSYPLTTCVVSGEKLGEMGKPVVINYQGIEVRFCCDMCGDSFKKDPAKYLAKLPSTPKS